MATGADAEFFAAQWGLDESARSALLQLDPDLQVKVITDFSPKPGTRDVNRLFHGFIKSVRTSVLAHGVQPRAAAEVPEVSSLRETHLAARAEQLAGQSWHVQTDTIDVEAFLNRWGLDSAAHAMMAEQSPEVQARVVAEFAPKPGTRDVNRLFHGFIRSVRSSGGAPRPAASQLQAAVAAAFVAEEDLGEQQELAFRHAEEAAAVAQEEEAYISDEVYRYATDDSLERAVPPPAQYAYHPTSRGLSGAVAAPQRSAAPGVPQIVDVPSFIAHWNLDAAAQAALQQLAPEVQVKVLEDFAPKAGTRDVNRLFHGFIRSVQTNSLTKAPAPQPNFAVARAPAAANPHGYVAYRPPASRPGAAAANPHGYVAYRPPASNAHAAAPAAAHAPAASYAAAEEEPEAISPEATARLQAFVDHWGLDAGSVTALVQLTPEMQTRVVTEFAPKPNTQDVNRLFRGFIRSVLNIVGERQPRIYTITKQELEAIDAQAGVDGSRGAYAGYGGAAAGVLDEGQAGDAGYADDPVGFEGAYAAVDSAKRAMEGDDEPPTREELDQFLRTWSLSEECLITLEGQSPGVQRRVLDQFRPKPGTRDVRSLFFGFIRSLAAGGAKRPRVA